MRRALQVILLTVAFALGTWFLGWWSVPLIAAVAAVGRRGITPWIVTVCAVAAWAALLIVDATAGPFGRVAAQLNGIMSVPTVPISLLFAAGLAWSAATLARWRRLPAS